MIKKKIIGSLLALSIVASIGSVVYADETHKGIVLVPNYGGNYYTATATAPDQEVTATVTLTVPANQNIYGTVNNQQHSNISSETLLGIGLQQRIKHSANTGTAICMMFETGAFNSNNTSIAYGWTP